MFLGLSKNIGNGFRIGVSTRLFKPKRNPSVKEANFNEFVLFLNKSQNEINAILAFFMHLNGYDFNKLMKDKTDINLLFDGDDNYNKFISKFKDAKESMDKVIFSGDMGIVAKRKITNEIFELKSIVNSFYPDSESRYNSFCSKFKEKNSSSFNWFFMILAVSIIYFLFFNK